MASAAANHSDYQHPGESVNGWRHRSWRRWRIGSSSKINLGRIFERNQLGGSYRVKYLRNRLENS